MSGPDFNKPINVDLDGIHWAKIYFVWSQETVGFGECSISKLENGELVADTEGMGKEWVRRALYAVVDTLVENMKVL
jgi:hypothetical protein